MQKIRSHAQSKNCLSFLCNLHDLQLLFFYLLKAPHYSFFLDHPWVLNMSFPWYQDHCLGFGMYLAGRGTDNDKMVEYDDVIPVMILYLPWMGTWQIHDAPHHIWRDGVSEDDGGKEFCNAVVDIHLTRGGGDFIVGAPLPDMMWMKATICLGRSGVM